MNQQASEREDWRIRYTDATDDALILSDGAVVLDCNRRAIELFRYENAAELLGQALTALTPDGHSILEACDEDTAGAVTGTHSEGLVRRDGERFTAIVSVSVLGGGGARRYVLCLRDITARLAVQEPGGELDQAYLRTLFEHSPEAIAIVDRHGTVLEVNSRFLRMFGYTLGEVLGKDIDKLIVPEPLRAEAADLTQAALAGMDSEHQTQRRRKDGTVFAASILAAPIFYKGSLVALYVIYRDISRLKEVEQKLQQTTQELNAVISQAPIAIFTLDRDARFTFCAGRAMQQAGLKQAELVGKSAFDLFPELPEVLSAVSRALGGQSSVAIAEFRGASYELQFTPIKGGEGSVQSLIGVARDITDTLLARKQLEFMAHHDILTGLPNRTLFHERVREALRRAQRHRRLLAVLFIDLDRFKTINDTLGHLMGDRVIQHIAVQCTSVLREVDTVARLGGDEFAVLVEEVEGREAVAQVAERLLAAIGKPYVEDECDLTVMGSIGISLYPQDGLDVDTLLKHADAAMYRAKEEGRGRFAFYETNMQASASSEYFKTTLLRKALDRGDFVLHYQPSVRVADLAVVGVEALVRLRQPDGRLMPPLEFIALAEETGLIIPIGRWVLEEACRQLKSWLAEHGLRIRTAINLSARQFHHSEFLRAIADNLAKLNLPPELFMVEITESTLFPDPHIAQVTLAELRAMKIAVSLDDFGTGFSSLGYLKEFPVDYVKVDRSFIAGTPNDSKSCGITRTILSLARNLEMGMIAEGVETLGQFQFLRRIGCDEVQGYLFGHPVEATALLSRFKACQVKDQQPLLTMPEQ